MSDEISYKSTPSFFFFRGQNPLHVLGQYGKENAAAIFELFLECMPKYPIDMPDAEGNTRMYILSFPLMCLTLNLISFKCYL